MNIAGVVLAGGRSSRMGRDKALLRPFGDSSPPMLATTWRLVTQCASPCWVSCAPGQPYAGYPCLFDDEKGQGPLSGVTVALRSARAASCDAVLTLPCDLPFMDVDTLRALLSAHDQSATDNLVTMYSASSGRAETLVAVYATAALPFLESALSSGRRCLFQSIPADKRQLLYYDETCAQRFFNINDARDLALVVTLLSQQ